MKEGVGSGQYGEDRILAYIFKDQKKGFLVDVGAADGYTGSNSIGLLKRPGWKGVLIEPEPEQFSKLQSQYPDRKKVICINCGAGKNEGFHTFYISGQVSTFKKEVKKSAEKIHHVTYKEKQIYILTLTHLLDQLEIEEPIDFLSIDAEGMDFEIWESLDQKKYSPKLVCIEGCGFRMIGYRYLCQVGGNTFYLREKDAKDLIL